MTAKKSGWLFFSITLIYIAVSVLLSMGFGSEKLGVSALLWISEGIIAVPAFLFLVTAHEPLHNTLALHKISVSTFFLSILFVALLGPLVTLCNAVTMLFTENVAADILSTVSEVSIGGMFFFVGILAPVCEECVFRGILYTGFLRNGTPLKAICWSAVLFGLFHMNLNQMAYAIVLGIAFGLLREATGSIWAGMIGHISLNSFNVFLYYIQSKLPVDEIAGAEETLTQEMLLTTIGAYLVIALFSTALAVCVLAAIAKKEQRQEDLKGVWTDKRKLRVWSIPLWIGILLCAGLILMDLLLPMLAA